MSDTSAEARTPLPVLLERRVRSDRTVSFVVPADWMQGRTTFGGLTAALAVQAMRDVEGKEWPLRALQASFIGPVGGPTSVEVTLLRQGRNVRQVQATLRSGGEVAAVVLAAFGQGRATIVEKHLPAQPPAENKLEGLIDVPFVPGMGPNFLQHLVYRWAGGEPPWVGRQSWHSKFFCRPRDPGVDQELVTILVADMPPSPVLSAFDRFVPASSVSWELEFVPGEVKDANGFYRIDTDVVSAVEGYVNQRSTLWSPDGSLVALGYQVVGVYG
jgi:acyl-CoA thioesterase